MEPGAHVRLSQPVDRQHLRFRESRIITIRISIPAEGGFATVVVNDTPSEVTVVVLRPAVVVVTVVVVVRLPAVVMTVVVVVAGLPADFDDGDVACSVAMLRPAAGESHRS